MSDVMIALCILVAFVNGFLAALVFMQHRAPAKAEPAIPQVSLSESEIERIRQEKEDLLATQKAFLDMMGYNPDIAYGVGENPLEGG